MSLGSGTPTFIIALVVVLGSFGYLIMRGGADAVVVPIIALSLGTVLSYFFAQHLSNSAATTAVEAQIATTNAAQTAADHATTAAAAGTAASDVKPKV